MTRSVLRYVKHRITQQPDTCMTFEAECMTCDWKAEPSTDGAGGRRVHEPHRPDGTREQAPYERLTAEQFAEYEVTSVEDSTDEECSTGACPVG
ncbi:DUF7848 domain-containing protein [Streptomyces sp. enrichment culture]|uniref:DUF7848 domain-containing protein n=1 Tax=Streptomyces sp. enrichment culture TaxID=1795815 RepID=UPI003F56FE6E